MIRYAITDRSIFDGSLPALLERIRQIAPAIDYLQIRERDLTAAVLEHFTRSVIQLLATLPQRPRVLVNHRADIAIAAGAAGVHIPSSSGQVTPVQVREIYRLAALPDPIIGVSCHTLEEVGATRSADLILFGPIFGKTLAPPEYFLPGVGLERLSAACRATPIPVLALGGVTGHSQEACLQAGAAGIAGIRHFLQD